MDTRYLEYILALAETGNITRAAQNLYISQPTLSQFLAKKEAELGTPLFQRSKGVYTLTPAGSLYADYARKVIALTDVLNEDIKRASNTSRIRLGTSASRALQMLTAISGEFRRYYPKIELILSDNNLHTMRNSISRGELDLAFVTANSLEQFKKQSLELKKEEVVFAAPSIHPYCQKLDPGKIPHLNSQLLLEHFRHNPFILQHKGSCIRYLIESFFEKQEFHPPIACTTSHAQSICEMVSSNIGVAFVPTGYAVPTPNITYFRLNPPLYRIHAILYRQDLIQEAHHKLLIELAQKYVAKHWQNLSNL